MSHLRIAARLLDKIGGLDPEMFAIGSIGPDSGLPDEKWQNFDPPKKVSHFEYLEGSSDCADLDFYRQHLADASPQDARQFSFLLGYFFHLVTDNLWLVKIWRPHKARRMDWYERDQDSFNVETKRDWYGLDFIYVRDHPVSFFQRVFMGAEYDAVYLPFMSPAAFEHQLNYIKTFYQRTDERVQAAYERPFEYLSAGEMDRFVDEAVDYLFRVHELVIGAGAELGGVRTVLDLIPV